MRTILATLMTVTLVTCGCGKDESSSGGEPATRYDCSTPEALYASLHKAFEANDVEGVLSTWSQATRACRSSLRNASRIASEIWSQTLSGCPSETDSEVKM